MSVSDLTINSAVRRILSRHWVDLSEIRFGAFRGTVRFTGVLCHLSGRLPDHGKMTLLGAIEQETRRICGVQHLHFDVSNWTKDKSGNWKELSSKACSGSPSEPNTQDNAPSQFEIKDSNE